MARYRLTASAKADIASTLLRSEEIHGKQARIRYRALLMAALHHVAANPGGPMTSDRTELGSGVHSFHTRHSRRQSREARVASSVHVVIYRALRPGVVEIVRVLHERMEASQHIVQQKKIV